MFGTIVGAMLIVYAVLTVAMVIALPIVVVSRIRRGMEEDGAATSQPRPLETDPFVEDQLEVERQRRRVDLRLDAEAAAHTHDRVREAWLTREQTRDDVAEAVETDLEGRLLDALETAQRDRVDPEDPDLDHYVVGLYVTRVRDLEAAWEACESLDDGVD